MQGVAQTSVAGAAEDVDGQIRLPENVFSRWTTPVGGGPNGGSLPGWGKDDFRKHSMVRAPGAIESGEKRLDGSPGEGI